MVERKEAAKGGMSEVGVYARSWPHPDWCAQLSTRQRSSHPLLPSVRSPVNEAQMDLSWLFRFSPAW